MKDHQFPPHQPTDKSKWFKRAIIFAAIVLCAYQFGFKPLFDNHRGQWNVVQSSEGEYKGKILLPGYHFISSFPFVLFVEPGEFVIKDEYGIKFIPVTEIPFGYVGVITDRETKGINPKVLTPGKYHINTDLYKIDMVFTEKQTYYFGNN